MCVKTSCTISDPVRGGENILVMCEVMNVDMTPHASNTRAALVESAENFGEFEPWFGMEQEYTFYEQSYDSLKYGQPLGFPLHQVIQHLKVVIIVASVQTKFMEEKYLKLMQLLAWKPD